ncbi:PilZ domain-containing protein [endosymbiont of Ridgeia piscesae]|jgi:hypothetical protein|uniref:PilZ domain n=1 Tax=endosymbiont of Ridgeia piscesae TaxID=54398 RepID=A0A0T5ZBJ6_9GAMM|nr:PilZ domain-containing protein [endosymbiont of Ridgeia piscesae]KRT53997.1 PilZ domain [endosymbiont of Ridgeia piscesae]KRT60191.1 PilZ domain-containing protein [endosymbiont of Ridgeia piscesae]
MLDYAEKRDFVRMEMDCPARFRISGQPQLATGIVRNLSSSGLLLEFDQELATGTELALEILPGKSITPPFAAILSVIRSSPIEHANFSIACAIERILGEKDTGPDFP